VRFALSHGVLHPDRDDDADLLGVTAETPEWDNCSGGA
jgi:hypothetical protein